MSADIADLRRPVIGVGAVVWRGEDVLLVRRAGPPLAGQWSIPGGRLEFGEETAAACRREIREETGVEVEIAGLIDVVDAILRHENGCIDRHYVLIDYAARHVGGELRAGGDATDAKWVAYEDISDWVSWDETRRIIAQSRKFNL